MLYSHDYRCIFIHIPKCAGTSIEVALDLKFVISKSLPFTENRWHCTRHKTIQKLGTETWEDYFKFSFVRNPWDRVISAWKMFETKPWCKLDKSYSLKEFVDIVIDETVDFKAKYMTKWQKQRWEHTLENVRHHTLPASHHYYGLVENGSLSVDFCGRFESLQADFSKIVQRIGVDIKLPHKLKTSRALDYQAYYSDPGLIRILEEYYKQDCELFGYEF